ncbi:MAG TPA: acyl-CoA desaturase [Kofleriaceae bacterium]|jgi:linoleoyl-CoA desaturase|nr:acyl-CoA desaturase [Kofleriaceae bacterium]
MSTPHEIETGSSRQEPLAFVSDHERAESFARAVDALRRELEARVGSEDVAYIQGVRALSSSMEVAGRALIHFSLEPVSFGLGVLALSVHKTLELMEIGHSALHGAYDRLPGATGFRSDGFRWKAPIDEESWRSAHNIRHHQYTNIAGRDPDLDFGGLRLSERVGYRRLHALQPASNLLTWLGFATAINLHATGVLEVYLGRDRPRQLRDRSLASVVRAHGRFFRKWFRYYAREYVLFPALAGPFFWKIWLGNVLSEVARDVYAGATIYCGHVGATDFAPGARPGGRGQFYVAQVEAAHDIEVPPPMSILSGGLDRQIEHHLFPRLPPNRLRQIAPRVREICEQHGVRYRTDRWPHRLSQVVRTLASLARNHEAPPDALAAQL